jgi:hypothetical protein
MDDSRKTTPASRSVTVEDGIQPAHYPVRPMLGTLRHVEHPTIGSFLARRSKSRGLTGGSAKV